MLAGQHLTLPQTRPFSFPILLPNLGEHCTSWHKTPPNVTPAFQSLTLKDTESHKVIKVHHFLANHSSLHRGKLSIHPNETIICSKSQIFFFFCWVIMKVLPIHMWTVNRLTDGILSYKQFQIHYSSMAVSVVYSIKKPQICLKVRKVRISAKHLHNSHP